MSANGLRTAAKRTLGSVLLLAVLRLPANAALFEALLGDANDSGTVSIGEIQRVVNNFLGAANMLPINCTADMVQVGSSCIDMYEASAWRIPNVSGANAQLVAMVKRGTATAAQLIAGGAIQLGTSTDDYAYAPCADNGQNCGNEFYAVSVAGVTPAAYVTWFQAQQACKNAQKRLPSNSEWQAAAAGTPDGVPCNVAAGAVGSTGTAGCVSSDGAFDMVGNLWEWVAEWVPQGISCPGWGAFSDDAQCFAGAPTGLTGGPGALLRGGAFSYGSSSGPLAVSESQPSNSTRTIGFRCAR